MQGNRLYSKEYYCTCGESGGGAMSVSDINDTTQLTSYRVARSINEDMGDLMALNTDA